MGAAGVGFTAGVRGDFTSTLTGGACESAAPQVKQYFASSALVLPQTLHIAMLRTLAFNGVKHFLTLA
jgi:hypothetical protein